MTAPALVRHMRCTLCKGPLRPDQRHRGLCHDCLVEHFHDVHDAFDDGPEAA